MTFVPDEELLAELKASFAVEAAEYVEALNRDLLTLERSESEDERQHLLKEIFRNAHSLKGGAAIVGLDGLKMLAHHLESTFGGLQSGSASLGAEFFELAYGSVDVIQRVVQGDGESADLQPDIDALGTRLEQFSTLLGDDPKPRDRGVVSVVQLQQHLPVQHREDPGSSAEGSLRQDSPSGRETIRIAVSKLDDLMNQAGEVVVVTGGLRRTVGEIAAIEQGLTALSAADKGAVIDPIAVRKKLNEILKQLEGLQAWTRSHSRRMTQVTDDLQEGVRKARMLPASTIFESFPRMVRDLAHSQEKSVRLEIRGGETEMDRAVLEQIKAPITHLLRNCVDHGLEKSEERAAAGKPTEGTVILDVEQRGETVVVQVSDDGAGIDVGRVKEVALAKGGIRTEDADEMDGDEILALIFRSGLSTSEIITSVSGRGVGLDVARENIEALNGSIAVDTHPGQGTTFTFILPLTVATTRCTIIHCGDQVFAVPLTHIVRTTRVTPEDVGDVEGRPAISLPGGPLPLRDLARILGLPTREWEKGFKPVLVVRCGEGSAALLVDEVLGVEDVVVKNLPSPLVGVRYTVGGSILGSGGVLVVLNVGDIVRSAVRSQDAGGISARRAEPREQDLRRKVLIADDSITTRTLEKNILETFGYNVRVAVNGAAAWDAIQADPPDLVVSDVQMPEMDGYELTAAIRADERFRYLPIVLVTSLESDTDRERGIEVGADAYIGKSSFDQEQLLDVVQRLI